MADIVSATAATTATTAAIELKVGWGKAWQERLAPISDDDKNLLRNFLVLCNFKEVTEEFWPKANLAAPNAVFVCYWSIPGVPIEVGLDKDSPSRLVVKWQIFVSSSEEEEWGHRSVVMSLTLSEFARRFATWKADISINGVTHEDTAE